MKKIILLGSGEFTKPLEPIDREILSLLRNQNDPLISIIPTAAGQEADYYKWIEMGMNHFKGLNARAEGIPIADRSQTNDSHYLEQITKSDIIYFSGGKPDYLFSELENTPFWKTVMNSYNKGSVLIGSSAGSMVMGNQFVSITAGEREKGKMPILKKGFGLLDYIVIPHFDRFAQWDPELDKIMLDNSTSQQWMGIEEDTALIIDENNEGENKGIRNVYIYKNSQKKVLKPNEKIKLSNKLN